MHYTLLDVEISERRAQLHENAPHGSFLNAMALFRLRKNEVTERVTIKELHDDIDGS